MHQRFYIRHVNVDLISGLMSSLYEKGSGDLGVRS